MVFLELVWCAKGEEDHREGAVGSTPNLLRRTA
jgi:hypothetical protein